MSDDDIQAMAAAIIPLLKSELENEENKKHLKGFKGTCELNLTQKGKKAGTWHIILNGDKETPQVHEGKAKGKPTLAVTIEDETLLKLGMGKLNPMTSFMSGKIKLSGNIMMAQRMEMAFRNANGYERARPLILAFAEGNTYLKSKL